MEERTWPDHAKVLSLMAHGFSYAEAWHMGHADYRRYSALAAAWAIPPDEREGIVTKGRASDTSSLV